MIATLRLASYAALALLSLSCSSAPHATRMDSSLLSRTPKEVKAPVNIARSEVAVAQDALLNAKKQTKNAAEAAELASQELNVAMARVDQARVEAVTTERAATDEESAAAQAAYGKVLQTASIARLGLALAKREREVAQLREGLALEELGLAVANLELVTGRAINGLDLPAADAVSVEDLRSDVSFHAAEVEAMAKRLSAGRVAMEKARGAYENEIAKIR